MNTIDRSRLHDLNERERQTFRERHPGSRELAEEAKASLLFGVPMNWMTRWSGDHPVFVERAEGAHFWDVDGNEYVDLCLGDTGGMAGHAPKVSVDAIAQQAAKGITLMLPTEDAAWVGAEMTRRFGVPYWSFTLTATDANRFVIRWAREITGRSKIVVHNWCYHGSVDETIATLDERGLVIEREGNTGKPVPLELTTRVVEINDLEGLEKALAHGDVAACLFEPALTNIGIVLPDEDYHRKVRELCTKYGTLLIIDETHTISAGPRRLHEGVGPRARLRDDRQDARRRDPERRVRREPGDGRPDLRGGRLDERRRGRHRRHPRRQRAVARGDARHPRRGPDRRGVRAHDRARRAVRAGRAGGDRHARAAVPRDAAGLPGRVPVPSRPRPQRQRGRRRRRTTSSTRSSTCTC